MASFTKPSGRVRSASRQELKKAYRLAATKLHPDKNNYPNATRSFIELTEAYEVLLDSSRREHYDELLAHHECRNRIDEQKRTRWEQEVHAASQRGKKKGTRYSEDFNYFSRKVVTSTILMLIVELLLGIIFGGDSIVSWLFLSLVMTIAGIVIFITGFGQSGLMTLGSGLFVLGALWFRREVRRENEIQS
ncbi:MAG: DnaJ domain-containing protein [Tunicatimonas sp.]